jgi:IS30 family transposase
MRRKKRKERVARGYSEAQREEMWDRWGRGESLKAIGRVFGKEGGSVYGQLAPYGGIRPRPRCRSPLALTLAEREEISRGVAAGRSMRSTSRPLGRPASTVSREISRNGGGDAYRATEAEERAWGRGRRPRRCRLSCSPKLQQLIEDQLRRDWSPEQIAGWLKRNYPEDKSYRASHETIYRGLYVQPGGGLRKGLTRQLPTRRSIRRS